MPVNWNTPNFQQNTQLDLSPLVEGAKNYTALSLANLTLSKEEKLAKKKAEVNEIRRATGGNPKAYMTALQTAGHFDVADSVTAGIRKREMEQVKFNQEQYKFQQQKREDFLEIENQYGRAAKAALESKNPVEGFMLLREDGVKKKLPLSQKMLNYMPNDEEISTGRIMDPSIIAELDFLSKKALPQKGPMSIEDKLHLMRERYGEKRNLVETSSNIKVNQPLTKNQERQRDMDLKKFQILGEKLGIAKENLVLDKEAQSVNLAGKSQDIEIAGEKWKEQKLQNIRKHAKQKEAYRSKLVDLDDFEDLAEEVIKNKNLWKVTGEGKLISLIPGGAGADLKGDVERLVSLGVSETMNEMKSQSATGATGFGSLQAEELKIMKMNFSTLGNYDESPEKKRKSLKYIISKIQKLKKGVRNLERTYKDDLIPEKTVEQEIFDRNTVSDDDMEGF